MDATQVKLSNFAKKPLDYPKGQDLKFQVLSWFAHDDHSNPDDPDSELVYKIYMFGNTMDSKSVCLLVNGYKPFFYIKIPDSLQKRWDNTCDLQFKTFLKSKIKFGFDNLQRVKKIDIYGFTNEKKENYLKLTFKSETAFKKAKYILRPTIYSNGGTSAKEDKTRLPLIPGISSEKLEFKIYEHNIQSYIRFCHEIDIDMAGWVQVSAKDLLTPDEKFSKCQIEFSTKWNNIKRLNEVKNSNFVVASFDIETLPEDRRSFPDANKKNDIVFQIGTTFYNHGTKEYTKHVTTMGNTKEKHLFKEVPDVVFHVVETEKEMIETWVRIIAEVSPDIITGYNIYNFDWKYIQTRARINKCEDFLQQKLSKLVVIPAEFKKDRLSSSAYGDNVMTYYDIPGMTNIDLFFTIKRDHKLESYSLDNVSSYFLNDNKVDMPYEEMFRKYDGTTADRIEISIYCAQDTFLVIKLIQRLLIISNNISMANKTKIPLLFVETKGQQIKVFSQLLAKTINTDYIVPTVHYGTANEDSFTGATVLTAKPGAYYVPISGLDFASLYPAIMISNNLCYSTIVLNDKYNNIPGVEYKTVEWTDTDGVDCKATYVQNKKGILPELLEELWKERKAVKKQMKTEKDPAIYDVLNGVQLAIKVSMNSIYGFTGATYGKLSEKKIASSVTALGRESIQQAKHYAELWYDCEVIYGDTDSIYVEFKTGLQGKAHFDKVFEISEEAAERISNTFKKPMELEFEKVMYPFLIMSKKRYASVIWTNKDKYDYIDYKGLQVKRRDSCAYVRKNGEGLFEELLLKDIYKFDFSSGNKNIEMAVESARNCITKLLNGQVPMNELILSRALKENYKNINVPHVALCRKMKERDPNNVPQIGDRVKYVFAQTGGPVKTQADLVEDPDYVIKNGIELNYFYYYEHQLKSMIETIFSILPIDQNEIFCVSDSFKPIVRKWASKVAKELALTHGLTLDDFPDTLKVKKEDILKLIKSKSS